MPPLPPPPPLIRYPLFPLKYIFLYSKSFISVFNLKLPPFPEPLPPLPDNIDDEPPPLTIIFPNIVSLPFVLFCKITSVPFIISITFPAPPLPTLIS